MTPEQVKDLTQNIVNELDLAADMAVVLDPALIPFVAIGKAVDKLVPGLAAMVTTWIEGNPPTDAEVEDMKAKLAVLGNPNNP